MIQYTLKCKDGHSFDSWFQSAGAFDKLQSAGHVACAICGIPDVEKAIMAPRLSAGTAAPEQAPAEKPDLTTPSSDIEKAMSKLRKHVEANSDYVGTDFASEARAIHDGTAPDRLIHGEARGDEAKKLIDEGVPIAPLPFLPGRKTN